MRESVSLTVADALPSPVQSVVPPDVGTKERIVLDHDAVTGARLKYYLQAADVEYWTDLWKQAGETSYVRASRGHLPHQLRQTFRRWARGRSKPDAGWATLPSPRTRSVIRPKGLIGPQRPSRRFAKNFRRFRGT